MDGRPQLVGRHTERRLVRHLLDQAHAGRHGVLVVSGAPGVGKTALVGWLAGEVTDGTVLRTSGGDPALPFAALLRLVASLPELVGARERWRGADGLSVAAAELGSVLAARARRRPLVVVVDDADELEPAASQVLEQVLAGLDDVAGQDLQLLAVLTAGTTLEPNQLIDRVLRLGSARDLPLGGLDEDDVFEMLSLGGSRPTPTAVHEVLAATGGLPLLVESEAELRVGDASSPATGVRVRGIADALRVRLDKVGDPVRSLLSVAALLPEPWGVDELAVAADLPVDAVAVQLDNAMAARLVERDMPRGDELRFAHPLLRAEVAAASGPAGRAQRHREIADRLDTASTGDDVVLRSADHRLRAHEEAGTAAAETAALATRLRRAGHLAMGWGAWHDASRFLSAAVDLAADQLTLAEQARHHLDAGTAAWFDHDADRCETELAQAMRAAAEAGEDAVRLRAAIRLVMTRVGEQPLRFGQRPAVRPLEEALAAKGLDVPLQVEGRAVLADAIFASGEADQALDLVAEARRIAPQAADPSALAGPLGRLEMAEGLHRLARLELRVAEDCFDRGIGHARAAGDQLAELTLRSRAALVALVAGRVEEAGTALAGIEQAAVDQRFWGEAGFAAAVTAVAITLAGDPTAAVVADRAERRYHRSGHPYTAAVVAPALAALHARGAPPKLAPAATQDVGNGANFGGMAVGSAVRVLASVEAYDIAAVRAGLRAARWRDGISGPATLTNLPVLAALVEAGDLLGDSDTVASAHTALVRADDAGVAVILGWPTTVARLVAIAARHAGDHAEARRHLARALQLIDHERLTAERGKVLLEAARQAPDAAVLVEEAARIFDACSMFGWLARCEAVADEVGVAGEVWPGRVVDDRTILTDDIVGSTAANARLGDALYLETLRVHDRIVRSRLRELGGDEIKHTGDGVNAIFRDPAAAVRCAVAIQADFAGWRRAEPDLALQVRCGLARGSLIPAAGDYFGLVQSEAARLCSLAEPGEVLVSRAVADGVDTPPDLGVESAGRHLLRGLADKVEVYRIRPV